MLAGLTGTVPNYLTYVNTVLCKSIMTYQSSLLMSVVLVYRVGGGSRLSGLMLAMGTAAIMMIGPAVIAALREFPMKNYLNRKLIYSVAVMVVGALIFVLRIDLLMEAVWDTRHRVNKMEYITIWAIAIGMTV